MKPVIRHNIKPCNDSFIKPCALELAVDGSEKNEKSFWKGTKIEKSNVIIKW